MRKLHWAGRAGLIGALVIALGLLGYVVLWPSFGTKHHQVPPLTLAAHSDGLSDTESGYRFEQVSTPSALGEVVPIEFRIIGPTGKPEVDFLPNQTKQMHFFVVRDDMQGFQHVHPVVTGDTWRTQVRIADGGAYRMYAEFVPKDTVDARHPVVLGVAFAIAGNTTLVPLVEPRAEATTGTGYTVTRTEGVTTAPVRQLCSLRFAIRGPDGKPVPRLEEHLGSNGHMTGFNTLLLSATHLHPVEPAGAALVNGELTFQALFGERGEHRMFLEFRAGGQVHTVAFTVFVT